MNRVKQFGLKHFLIVVLSVLLVQPALAASQVSSGDKLADDAKKQIGVTVSYDTSYRRLDFPRGDVPQETGMSADVIIRAYRLQNIDLQQLVHVDMKSNRSAYPKRRLMPADKNIDHRRVPNLETFFERHGITLSTTDKNSFQAGDIVTWRLPEDDSPRTPHIGIVSDNVAADGTPLIIHNMGRGTQEDNILFEYPIHKHFRY